MNDIIFEPTHTPWELAYAKLHSGEILDARRFLALIESSDDVLADDAALELEQKGVMLDVSSLPRISGNPKTQQRLDLEEKWLKSGKLKENLVKDDPLYLYLEELEETASSVRMNNNFHEPEDAGQLMNACLPMVLECAKEFSGMGVLLLDLLQEGGLGLWQGLLRFETGDLQEYALWWIRQAMARAVTLQAQANGIGANLSKQMEAYRKADSKLLSDLGRNPTELEISQEMGITLEESAELSKMLRDIYDLAKIKESTGNSAMDGEDELAVEDTAYYQQRERIDSMLSTLTEQEAQLVTMRYGLNGASPISAEEAAGKLGMTVEEAIAAESAALKKMRHDGE